MKNEKIFLDLVRLAIQAKAKPITSYQWQNCFIKYRVAESLGNKDGVCALFVEDWREVLGMQELDKAEPILSTKMEAGWSLGFKFEVAGGAVFVYAIVRNENRVSARVMASKEILKSDFDLMSIVARGSFSPFPQAA